MFYKKLNYLFSLPLPRLNSGLEGRDMISVNNASSDDERDDQPVILNTKGGTYKLRDSR